VQHPLALDQFKSESKILKLVDGHTNIVRVLDEGTLLDGNPYFTMSYIDGDDLKKIIFDRRRTLAPEEIYEFLDQIGSALAYAHGCGIKHRDIKPNNIIKAQDGRFFLTDFGIATLEDPSGRAKPQLAAMTKDYAAPEILNGGTSTNRSDVYSLGKTVLELCLNSRYDDAMAQSNGQPFRVLERNKTFSRFTGILQKAMESDPQRRYGSVAQFAGDFAEQMRRVKLSTDENKNLTPKPMSRLNPAVDPSAITYPHARRAQRANRVGVAFVFLILAVLVVAMLIFLNLQTGIA
jgi:serine/threonine protein kinase